ncbi:hypothetical protein [Rahnella sp. PD4]|uniref:hypothetical protein n=1 Tax=Rahnella sp. PD4 TaxID=3368611 RepID=UPI003BA36BAD
MSYRKIIIIPLSLFLIAGCEQKEQFLKETIKNMVYVIGGTFEMGDFCLEKYGERCAIPKNNASLPTHSVTLDSYYMGRYNITYSVLILSSCTRATDKTLSPPSDSQWVEKEIKNPFHLRSDIFLINV